MRRAGLRLALLPALAAIAPAALAAPRAKPEEPDPALRARIAALVLRRVDFGAISLIPVRFENARISGPFEEGCRTTYCVTAQMRGRTFGRPERARAIVRLERGPEGARLRAEAYDADACSGERSRPFPELESGR